MIFLYREQKDKIMVQERNKIHLTNFCIAGFSYWDGSEAWEDLHVGTKLQLVRENDNAFDPYAVAVYHKGLKLGFVPRMENREISKYLDMGWNNLYEVRIQKIDPAAHTEHQIGVIVYIKSCPNGNQHEK